MSKVFLINQDKRPLDPIHPAQARQLLRNRKAAVFRRFPVTLILFESRPKTPFQPLRVKIDPGAKTTGLALVNDSTGEVVWVAELQHRGFQIRDALTFQQQTDWFKESVTNIANTFTKRMGIAMHSNLDILGVLNPIKYPPFPPTTKALAVLVQRLDISAALTARVFTGEDR